METFVIPDFPDPILLALSENTDAQPDEVLRSK